MEKKNRAAPAIIGLVVLLVIAGCAGKLGYGSMKLAAFEGDTMTIETLAKNWKDYDVYFSGIDTRQPFGMIFDTKGDGKKITSDLWYKMEDEQAISDMVQWMISFWSYQSRLFHVRGADKQVYGYIFTPFTAVFLKQIEPNTLFAYDLKKSDFNRGKSVF